MTAHPSPQETGNSGPGAADRLRALVAKATPGPWGVGIERSTDHEPPRRVEWVGPFRADHDHWSGWTVGNEPDATLIVALHNAAPALARLAETVQSAIAEMDEWTHAENCGHDTDEGCWCEMWADCAARGTDLPEPADEDGWVPPVHRQDDCTCGYVSVYLALRAALAAVERALGGAA